VLPELERREGYNTETLRALRIAALVQDVGEAKVPGWDSVGDIAADKKTAATESTEQRMGGGP